VSVVKVGLLGLGTVGSGTVNVLTRNADEIRRRAGQEIRVVHASARDLSKVRDCDVSGIRLSSDPFEVVNDPEIQVVLELIGGYAQAKDLVLRAIDNGKHVITANKALLAVHGNEIFAAAERKGVTVAFEAAVGGGIPIIKAIREALTGNRIQWLAGIINGTSNFILTEMWEKGRGFDDVLKDAQRLGYAEADPTFDVEGIDAGHKLTILASIAFGIPLQFDKAYTEGITKITGEDVAYAQALGYRIKSLGVAKNTERGFELRVHPTLIPARRLMANVNGVMNAVLVNGDAVGPTLYYGAGAGSEPTASAVVGDLVHVVREMAIAPEHRVPYLAFKPNALSDRPILPIQEIETAYYLRMQAEDRPGVLAEVTKILGEQSISIEAIQQKEPAEGATTVPVVFLTRKVREAQMQEAIKRIEALAAIRGAVMRIRVESLA
jgi:homoserine dehydrogenase